jgi:DNA-binding Lrp family transcriptional regulator
MKLVKLLDQEGATLVSDVINQNILRILVSSERSVSELSKTLNIPTLKLWRRIQKLRQANLIELTRTQKVGNLEKKLYRATATQYVPYQYFNYQPKDPNLEAAYKIYAEIQKQMMTATAAFGDVPNDTDPIDYTLFVQMQTFTQICGKPEIQTKIANLEQQLTKFKEQK